MEIRVPLLPTWIRWLAVVCLAGFVCYVSIVAVPPETVVDTAKPDPLPLDKWRHFLAYAAIGYALAYATVDWDVSERTLAVGVIGVIVVYGIGIEFAQSLVPQRYFSLGDAYANALGALLAVPWYLVRHHLDFVPSSLLLKSIARRVR